MNERHRIIVNAPVERVYAGLFTVDFSQSTIVRGLLASRALPARLKGRGGVARTGALTLERALKAGFVDLGREPNREVVLGLIGQFWRAAGGQRRSVHDRADFLAFTEPGFAKTVWNFAFEPQSDGKTLVTTETRIYCSDPQSQRRFRLYWALIGPFSGLIRVQMLRGLRRYVEGA